MSKKNEFDLHESRLGTTASDGHRIFLHPEDVKGFWRTKRTQFYWFLIFLYLILPWIHVGGKQSILLDIGAREFTFFSHTFYAHNAPMVLFFLLTFLFGIGFITSVWGRVWCGWACPQTVFIDAIYRKIEVFVEGNPRQRKKLDEAPMNAEKFFKRSAKWILYTLASLHISHTFIGYFVGTRKLFWISLQSPTENLTIFITMLVITAIFLVDFGWFREQFCIIACPYGRFQSVMMDEHSMIVAYDEKRGEPRRQPGQKRHEFADCVDCFACVKACPTGIDIRRGVQLECIACTNCIDACDDVMEKTKREKGLIRYDTLANMKGEKTNFFKPRNFVYLGALLVVIAAFGFSVSYSTGLQATVLRGIGSPYKIAKTVTGEQRILNHFQVTLDQSGSVENKKVKIEILDKELAKKVELKTPRNPYIMKKNHARVNVFIKFDKAILKNGSLPFSFKIIDLNTGHEVIKEVSLVGPIN
jgi:cytochrome c oxidase accessory protein FixG